jgi:hypothetical protein
MNETRVELSKANELSNLANSFGSRPCLEQRMLGLIGMIAVCAYVNAYEFEMLWKNMALAQIQR